MHESVHYFDSFAPGSPTITLDREINANLYQFEFQAVTGRPMNFGSFDEMMEHIIRITSGGNAYAAYRK